MLIKERFKECRFSNSENVVVDYILETGLEIENMTGRDIAMNCFASPSTLVRISHKMGFSGWNELKAAYLKEEKYLQSHFNDVDANLPFTVMDNIMTIASKIATLQTESIKDTLSLIHHDSLQQAVQIIRKSRLIHLFAVSNNLLICQEFKHQMSRIQKQVIIHETQGELGHNAYLVQKDECALFLTYSGETKVLNNCLRTLKNKNIPTIVITNIGENTSSKLADIVLTITTREKLYSKISTFSTDTAFVYLLNVLYSCIFAVDYQKNLDLKIETSKAVESDRFTTIQYIQENE